MKSKYHIEDIDIKKINYEFIIDYAFWLKTERHCDHNSTVKYLSNFKKIIIICIKNGWLTGDSFIGYSLAKKDKAEKTALSEIELILRWPIKALVFPGSTWPENIFLFSCYAGLAYADVKKGVHH